MLEHHIEICHTIPCHQSSLREWVFSKCPKQSLPNCIEKCAGVTICSTHSNSELESDFWLSVLIRVSYLHSGYCTCQKEDLSACTEVTGLSGFGFLALGTRLCSKFLTGLESKVGTFVCMVLY